MQLAAIDEYTGVAVGSVGSQGATQIQARHHETGRRSADSAPRTTDAIVPKIPVGNRRAIGLFQRLNLLLTDALAIDDHGAGRGGLHVIFWFLWTRRWHRAGAKVLIQRWRRWVQANGHFGFAVGKPPHNYPDDDPRGADEEYD